MSTITATKIILNGWTIEAESDGLYATTPSGIKTKVELIDYRETPVPETATLRLQNRQTNGGNVTIST